MTQTHLDGSTFKVHAGFSPTFENTLSGTYVGSSYLRKGVLALCPVLVGGDLARLL